MNKTSTMISNRRANEDPGETEGLNTQGGVIKTGERQVSNLNINQIPTEYARRHGKIGHITQDIKGNINKPMVLECRPIGRRIPVLSSLLQ